MPHERQRWLHDLVERPQVVVWEGDPDSHRLHYVSPSAERLLGFPAQAVAIALRGSPVT